MYAWTASAVSNKGQTVSVGEFYNIIAKFLIRKALEVICWTDIKHCKLSNNFMESLPKPTACQQCTAWVLSHIIISQRTTTWKYIATQLTDERNKQIFLLDHLNPVINSQLHCCRRRLRLSHDEWWWIAPGAADSCCSIISLGERFSATSP